MFVVRVLMKDSTQWKYLGRMFNEDVYRDQLGLKYELKDLFVPEKEAREAFNNNVTNALKYGSIKAIALVECNSDYIPFTEHKVVDYREFD